MSEENSKKLLKRKVDKVVLTDNKKTAKIIGIQCQLFSAKSSIAEVEVCYSKAETAGVKISDVNVFNGYHLFMESISGFNTYYALNKRKLPMQVKMGSETVVKLRSINTKNRKSKAYFAIPKSYNDMLAGANSAR